MQYRSLISPTLASTPVAPPASQVDCPDLEMGRHVCFRNAADDELVSSEGARRASATL